MQCQTRGCQLDINWASTSVIATKCKTAETRMEVAKIALECLLEMKYTIPPTKPTLLSKFEEDKKSMDWKAKTMVEKEEIKRKIYDRDTVKEWWGKDNKVCCSNLSNAVTLENYIGIWLEVGNKEFGKKVWDVYKNFPDELRYGNSVIWRKKHEFCKGVQP